MGDKRRSEERNAWSKKEVAWIVGGNQRSMRALAPSALQNPKTKAAYKDHQCKIRDYIMDLRRVASAFAFAFDPTLGLISAFTSKPDTGTLASAQFS